MTQPVVFDDAGWLNPPYSRLRKEYDETKHPRDEHGRWTDAGGAGIEASDNLRAGQPTAPGVRAFLEAKATEHADRRGRENWRYKSAEEFVLKHGEPMQAINKADWPPEVEVGRIGKCYQNAMDLASGYPEKFTYCEGFAYSPNDPDDKVWPHAWVQMQDGHIIDNTWASLEADLRQVEYVGVRFPIKYVLDTVLESPFVAVISSPNGEPLLQKGLDHVKSHGRK